jgi:DNA polymerase (family 10)
MIAPSGPANAEIARIFREVADQLELKRANQFRVRAYRNAARKVEESGRSIASLALSTPLGARCS